MTSPATDPGSRRVVRVRCVELLPSECYFGKFGGLGQCINPGQYHRRQLGNMTDAWTWCKEHADREAMIPVPPGCGWTGTATEIAELGTTSLLPEECPDCGGKIEVYREDR